jgi:hypothetical protein
MRGKTYTVMNTDEQLFAVIDVPDHYPRKFSVNVAVLARIVGDRVVIEEDKNDRPLVNELVRAGIPREKIVCAYIGEKLPDDSAEPSTTP